MEFTSIKHTYQTISEIEQLSGYSLEDLRKLFAAGWELKPPTLNNFSMEELENAAVRDL